jgi:hypothetical protein
MLWTRKDGQSYGFLTSPPYSCHHPNTIYYQHFPDIVTRNKYRNNEEGYGAYGKMIKKWDTILETITEKV